MAKTTTKTTKKATTKKKTASKKTSTKKTTKKKATANETKIVTGNKVQLHYVGSFAEDGEVFDNSRVRNQPIDIVVGSGQLIPGLDTALVGMTVGDTKTINVKPEQGYGEYNAARVAELPKDTFPSQIQENLQVGMVLPLVLKNNPDQPFPAKAKEIKDNSIVFDLNHPLAGKEVNFDVEILGIEAAVSAATEGTEG